MSFFFFFPYRFSQTGERSPADRHHSKLLQRWADTRLNSSPHPSKTAKYTDGAVFLMVPLLASIPGVSDHFSLTWLLTYCGHRFHGCDVGINLKIQYRKPTFFVPYNLYDVKVSFEEHWVLTWKKWRAVPTFPRCIRIYFFFLSLYSMINMLFVCSCVRISAPFQRMPCIKTHLDRYRRTDQHSARWPAGRYAEHFWISKIQRRHH